MHNIIIRLFRFCRVEHMFFLSLIYYLSIYLNVNFFQIISKNIYKNEIRSFFFVHIRKHISLIPIISHPYSL